MPIITLGINHKTAPLALREKLAFAPEALPRLHQSLCQLPGVHEAVMLSTCNRSELYLAVDQLDTQPLVAWLTEQQHLDSAQLLPSLYSYQGEQMLKHLAKVAAGLDSLVLGEPQIFGQLKSAFAVAQEAGTVSSQLHPVFQQGFALAKQVRTRTAIGRHPVSVAYAAVSMAGHIFERLDSCTALLIGAGETIELVARHLRDRGVRRLIIANRTLARAEHLALQFNAQAILLGELPEQLHHADIVISSTASQLPLLGKGMVESALQRRRHKPMFMVDIAVPRDIEPEVASLDEVFLYTVDDLQQVIVRNQQTRVEAADQAEEIIEQGVAQYLGRQQERAAADSIQRLHQQAQARASKQAKRHLKYIRQGQDPEQVLERLAQAVAKELLHPATLALRHSKPVQRPQLQAQMQQLLALNLEDNSKT